jgi:hypothetical protein
MSKEEINDGYLCKNCRATTTKKGYLYIKCLEDNKRCSVTGMFGMDCYDRRDVIIDNYDKRDIINEK